MKKSERLRERAGDVIRLASDGDCWRDDIPTDLLDAFEILLEMFPEKESTDERD